MNKTVIYFLRHGLVQNPKMILYGRLPGFRLSDQGRTDVQKAADFFKTENIDQIYTSPMLRARETANIIGSRLGLKPKISLYLIEVRLIFQGITIEKYHRKIQQKLYHPDHIAAGQEDIPKIKARMEKFIKKVLKNHKGQQVLAVSHGDPLLIIRAAMQGTAFTWGYKKANYLQPAQWFKLTISDGLYKLN